LRDWYKENPGEEITAEDVLGIKQRAQNAKDFTYWGNNALIYATNAITFGTLFKSGRLTNKAFNLTSNKNFKIKPTKSGDVFVEAIKETSGVRNWAKRKIADVTWKSARTGAFKWLLESSVEGSQEIMQDFVSSASSAYNRNGGQFMASVKEGMANMHAESFLSGMLMGTFASPVGFGIQQANNFIFNGGYESIINSEEYKRRKESRYDQLKEDAKLLTEYFNTVGNYAETMNSPVWELIDLQEAMAEAGENNDRKGFEDRKADILNKGMLKLFEHGLEEEMYDHLNGLKKHTAQELNESLGRTDITEENIGKWQTKIDSKINQIKEYKEKYDKYSDMVNPINPSRLDRNDPDYMMKKYFYHAFEKRREQLILSEGAMIDLSSRLNILESQIADENLSTSDIKTLLTQSSLNQEIAMLEAEIKSNKEYDVNTEENKTLERKLNGLKKYKKALLKYEKLNAPENSIKDLTSETESVFNEMFEAFNDIVTGNAGLESTVATRVKNRQKFDLFWDYLNNTSEYSELQEYVNLLNDPNRGAEFIQKMATVIQKMDENKEENIRKSLEAFEDYKTSNEMINELLQAGYIFDLNEIDDLIKNGIMPTRLYNVTTNEELSKEEFKAAQAIIKKHITALKGEIVFTEEKDLYSSRQKTKGDKRTSRQLYKQYSNGKKNTRVPLKDFIDRLLKNKLTTYTEREILKRLALLDFGATHVILTDNLSSPIEIKDNVVYLDVRFSAENFENQNTPFEYMAVSGLLRAQIQDNLKSNSAFRDEVVATMEQARDAYIEETGELTAANLEIFSNPAVFLSESLNNPSLQSFLATIEDGDAVTDIPLWQSFVNVIRTVLNEILKGDNKLLNRAMNLAQMALDEELVASVTAQTEESVTEKEEEPSVDEEEVAVESEVFAEAGEETPVVEEEIEEETNAEKRVRLEKQIADIQKELAKKPKGFFAIFSRKRRQLNQQLFQLEQELENIPEEVEEVNEVEFETPSVNKTGDSNVTSDGKVLITDQTKFEDLPLDLQIQFAKLYLNTKTTTTNEQSTDNIEVDEEPQLDENGFPIPVEQAPSALDTQGKGFDQKVNENTQVPEKILGQLDKDDMDEITKLMSTHPRYIKLVGEYNAQFIPDPYYGEQEKIAGEIALKIVNEVFDKGSFDVNTLLTQEEREFFNQYYDLVEDFVERFEDSFLSEGRIRAKGKGKFLENLTLAELKFLLEDENVLDVISKSLVEEFGEDIEQEKLDEYIDDILQQEVDQINTLPMDQRIEYLNALLRKYVEAGVSEEYTDEDFESIFGTDHGFSKRQISNRITKLNAKATTIEKIQKEIARLKAKKKKNTQNQTNNIQTNLQAVEQLIEDYDYKIPTGLTGRRSYVRVIITPLGMNLFIKHNPGVLELSPEQFTEKLNDYLTSNKAYADSIKKNKNLPYQFETSMVGLMNLKQKLIAGGLFSEMVINEVNKILRRQRVPFKFKNTSVTGNKKLLGGITVVPQKAKVTKTRTGPILPKAFEYVMGTISPGVPLTKVQFAALFYDWLRQGNRVHPETAAFLSGEKRTYIGKKNVKTKNEMEAFSTNGLAEDVAKDYRDELDLSEEGWGMIEDILLSYASSKDLLNFMNEEYERSLPQQRNQTELPPGYYEEYYNSIYFLLEEGLYDGNINDLSELERKIYEKNKDKYLDPSDIKSSVSEETIVLEAQLNQKELDEDIYTFVGTLLSRIESDNVEVSELFAIYNLANNNAKKLGKDAATKLKHNSLGKLEDTNFINGYIRLKDNPALFRVKEVIRNNNGVADKIMVENLQTNEFETFDSNTFVTEQLDEFYPNDAIYIPEELRGEISDENANLYKESYSSVFEDFVNAQSENDNMDIATLKANLRDTMNKCKL
jgi:hypothetical protein